MGYEDDMPERFRNKTPIEPDRITIGPVAAERLHREIQEKLAKDLEEWNAEEAKRAANNVNVTPIRGLPLLVCRDCKRPTVHGKAAPPFDEDGHPQYSCTLCRATRRWG